MIQRFIYKFRWLILLGSLSGIFSILLLSGTERGWPSEGKLPEKVAVWSVQVQEPDPQRNFSGAIYVWALMEEPTDKCTGGLICIKRKDPYAPRAYKLSYSKNMHIKMLGVMSKLGGGEVVIMESKASDNIEVYNLSSAMERLD